MTAEEIAEIRKRHASDQRTYEYAAESAGSTRPFGGFGPKQHQDRADLLTHTDAQAQRIAELEAEIERRNAVYDGAKAICDNPPPPNDALKNLMRKTPPWASATAQAVTLTEGDRKFVLRVAAFLRGQDFDEWPDKLIALFDRLTNGASTPAHPTEGEKL